MKIFADTANLDELKELLSWGIIDGCTTNPSIVSKEKGIDFETRMKEIIEIVKGPISIEVTSNDLDEMIRQSRKFAKWGNNVNVKIPMGITGLKAVNILNKEGIKTNVTACMCTKQAVLAAKAGATFVSLFWARIEDMGYNAEQIVCETVEIFERHKIKSEIILGSFRQVSHINRAMLSGAHILTIPTPILMKLPWNPRTESTIQEFLDNWEEFKKR
ncbi:fructose-6-phosphate aldolase [Candidatus Woesearchaeota archaeon]|nr:fructose-6-phosphate aldolase [Candidatus Woesearchaeota archaeon]